MHSYHAFVGVGCHISATFRVFMGYASLATRDGRPKSIAFGNGKPSEFSGFL